MKELLEDLLAGKRLSVEESRHLMHQLLHESVGDSQAAALLTVFRMRRLAVEELEGFSLALLDLSIKVDLSAFELIDVCGTGGDNKGTFNISTIVSFVLAGAGYKVAKHGNYAVSSSCGSSNVLEQLGVTFSGDQDALRRTLERAGICFLHAPLFHPALKRLASVRRELGIRTVFNALGPLVNPVRPAFQMNGVYDLELLRLYSYVLARRGTQFGVVHAFDGYDEISLTGAARVVWNEGSREVYARDFGLEQTTATELTIEGGAQESASVVLAVLEGRGTKAQEGVVVANAALSMWCRNSNTSLPDYVQQAQESIRSGAALRALELTIQG